MSDKLKENTKSPSVYGEYINFLRQRKTALEAQLYAVSAGRSMIEMLGVLAIVGVRCRYCRL